MTRRALPSFLLTVVVACGSPAADEPAAARLAPCKPEGPVSVGERLPECSFEALDGSTIRLADFGGRPLVLNFWATWCGNCIREMPAFDRVHSSLDGRVAFLGMDLLGVEAETRRAAERLARETKVRYPLAYDPDGLLYSHFGAVGRPIMPLTVFVDAQGRMRERHFGELTEAELRERIRDLFRIS